MTDLAGKCIVMTGATGFIGSHVAELLLAQGARVYALVRPGSANRNRLSELANRNQPSSQGQLHLISGSLEDAEEKLKEVGRADAFLHFAWGGVNRKEIDSPQVQAANIAGSLGCVRAAISLGCQVFMDAGSRVEYGITPDGTMEESLDCSPVNEYGKAKLEFYQEAEKLCREYGMTYYHLRFFSVYGAGDHPWSIISTLTRELPEGKTVSLSACRHRWNFMHIDDAARAVVELYRHSDRHKGEISPVNIASEDTRVLKEFTEEIHRLCGGAGQTEYGTFVQAKEGALSICPRVERLKELTDGTWREEVSFEAGICRLLPRPANLLQEVREAPEEAVDPEGSMTPPQEQSHASEERVALSREQSHAPENDMHRRIV